MIAVAVPLGVISKDLDARVVEIIEGFSKVITAVCIVQLSLKISGMYWKVSIFPCKNKNKTAKSGEKEVAADSGTTSDNISSNELRFNVAWNIWREMAGCGVFLIPFFLGSGAEAIPISALVGIVVALFLGAIIYYANHKMQNKFWLAFFMSGLTLMLAVGLFVGGCHEFEEVWGETDVVWKIENEWLSHDEFPFVILKALWILLQANCPSDHYLLDLFGHWTWISLPQVECCSNGQGECCRSRHQQVWCI